jgi:site-specific recombinase XerC
MLDIDYLFSEDKDVIIAVLVEKIRDQTCDLENVTERAESSALELRSAKSIIAQLERDLAAAKKAAKALKAPKEPKKIVRKIAPKDMDAKTAKTVKATGGTAYALIKPVAPVKRGRGRPKKAVA